MQTSQRIAVLSRAHRRMFAARQVNEALNTLDQVAEQLNLPVVPLPLMSRVGDLLYDIVHIMCALKKEETAKEQLELISALFGSEGLCVENYNKTIAFCRAGAFAKAAAAGEEGKEAKAPVEATPEEIEACIAEETGGQEVVEHCGSIAARATADLANFKAVYDAIPEALGEIEEPEEEDDMFAGMNFDEFEDGEYEDEEDEEDDDDEEDDEDDDEEEEDEEEDHDHSEL